MESIRTQHSNLPPAGSYVVKKGDVLPEWFRQYFSAPWPLAYDFEIIVDEYGGVTFKRLRSHNVPS